MKLFDYARKRDLKPSNAYIISEKYRNSLNAIYNLETLEITSVDPDLNQTFGLSFNEEGNLLVYDRSSHFDAGSTLVVKDWASNKVIREIATSHTGPVNDIKFLNFSGVPSIVSCSTEGQVLQTDFQNERLLTRHSGTATQLCPLPSETHSILSAGGDGYIRLCDSRKDLSSIVVHLKNKYEDPLYINTIDTGLDDPFLMAVGGFDSKVKLFDRRQLNTYNPSPLKSFLLSGQSNSSVPQMKFAASIKFSSDGTFLLVSYKGDDIYLYDVPSHNSTPLKCYRGRMARFWSPTPAVTFFSPNDKYIVGGSQCGHIFLWDRDDENVLNCIDQDTFSRKLAVHPNQPMLATSSMDKVQMLIQGSPIVTKTDHLLRLQRVERVLKNNFADNIYQKKIRHYYPF